MQALGMIEVYGYLTAVEALDSALKAANVSRLGVEKVRGGLVTVLVEGDVGAVKAAMDASAAAAERVGTVISVHVIPRPADDVTRMLKGGKEPEEPTPPEPEKPSEPEISSEPDTLSEPESEAVKAEEGEKAPQDVTVEEMQAMGVDALRRLARALEIKNMTRAEIRFAKKQELIQKITEFKES
ncbi:BMC domain-containing protein [Hominiventricola filiformis]|uniref:BMC domain-containing protein n=1 Tax=Hominiventricola filiformis TaxID=2885352 RepID=UPI0027E52BC3|nr:BMC domain-containing protein [Hominiventricola filiformis]